MAEVNEALVRSVLQEVLSRLGESASSASAIGGGVSPKSYAGRYGLFEDPNEAVAAANDAYDQLSRRKIAERKKMIDEIRYDTDLAHRVETMHKAEDMLMDTGAIIPIYYYNDVYMQKSNVTGIYATVFGMKYFMHAVKN